MKPICKLIRTNAMKNKLNHLNMRLFIKFSSLFFGVLFYSQSFAINYISTGSGTWTVTTTWSPAGVPAVGDNVTIVATHTVVINSGAACNDLIIENGARLRQNSALTIVNDLNILGPTGNLTGFSGNLTVRGDFTNNGIYDGIAPIILSVNPKVVSGTGTFANTVNWTFSIATTIAAGTTISKASGSFLVATGITVTNNGSVSLSTGRVQFYSGSTWVNGASSSLLVGTNMAVVSGSATLTATANPNTVTFSNSTSYTMFPSTLAATFYNLNVFTTGAGSSTKTLARNTTINGTLTIGNTGSITTFNANARDIVIRRDLTFAGTTPNITNNTGTMTFNGASGVQTISGTITTLSIRNLTISNAAGVIDSVNTNRSGSTTLTSGVFTSTGTLTYNGTAAQTIVGAGGSLISTGNFVINNASGVTSSRPVSIRGTTTLTLGNFIANSTLTFDGSVAQTITGGTGSIVSAGGFTLNNASGVSSSMPVSIRGASTTLTSGNFSTSSAINFDGSVAQTISGAGTFSGTSVSTITVNNAAGVTTSSAMTTDGTILISSGTFATGVTAITLTSTAAATARIDESAGNITGTNWRVYRYVPASDTGWQDISSPVTGGNISTWDDSLFLSMDWSCPDGMTSPAWQSVYKWIPGPSSCGACWDEVTSCAEAINMGQGIELWMATTLTALNATTFRSIGTPTIGTETVSISGTVDYCALTGNIYASAIDFDDFWLDNTHIYNYFELYDEVNHTYSSYDCTGGPCAGTGKLAGSDGTIPSHQGFWVYNETGASSILTFNESHKTSTNIDMLRAKPVNEHNILRMRIHSNMIKNAHESLIRFNEIASESKNNIGDVPFRKSRDKASPSLTPLSSDNQKLSISTIPFSKTDQSVELIASLGVAGEYNIDFKGVNSIPYSCIILEDKTNNSFTLLDGDMTYSFTQADIFKERKLVLHFKKQGSESCKITSIPSSSSISFGAVNADGLSVSFDFEKITDANVIVYSSLGQVISKFDFKVDNNSIRIPLPATKQVYFVQITTPLETVTKKIIF